MSLKRVASMLFSSLRIGLASIALFQFTIGAGLAAAAPQTAGGSNDSNTTTPIKHVIVIIGENRSFDHVFATYVPKKGQSVWNLLSEGIVNADGTPGPNFNFAAQWAATDQAPDSFLMNPPKSSFPNGVLPAPLVGGPHGNSFIPNDSLSVAHLSENGLPPNYYQYLVSGGTLLPHGTPDTRIANVTSLPAGPFQLTGPGLSYNDYAASPVHRFFQMWQQLDCDAARASETNPSGCASDLYPWVEVTQGAGANGRPQPANFSTDYAPGMVTTGEGSTSMGFYNMQQGDVPYFKRLADNFSMSDNFHQSVNGGTGANHIMLGHGDVIYFADSNGNSAVPPEGVVTGADSSGNPIVLNEIENPNPVAGTNNWYTEDGYGGGSFGSPAFGGGSYVNCSDTTQPGVAAIANYLKSLPRPISPRCKPGVYYLLNNYNPGYFGDGSNAYTDTNSNNTIFTIPPSAVPSIGDDLNSHSISWKYYGDQWDNYLTDKYQLNYGAIGTGTDEYCNICNPFQYDTSIMTDPAQVSAHLQDTVDLYNDIKNGTLPAVSFVKPSGLVDGHPASSKLNLFEGFVQKIVNDVKQNQSLWASTAIFVTFDEGGGYWDSGYVQPLDFFGDGTRIPLIVVSPFSRGGHISHSYSDHVSILKFIEANWSVPPVTSTGRDNFPNPEAAAANPYAPTNSPAISDLMDLFNFDRPPLH
ncbi:MAG TPA: alkaline phosphatase family protein [Candidatus Acidoferrales bacterium]|nr:alkaline phosphatase family protein [Candidatus Acidoferrales bacterium]